MMKRLFASVALGSVLLAASGAGMANDNVFALTFTNHTKDTIDVTGFQTSLKPGPIVSPVAPITVANMSPETATIAPRTTTVFAFNAPDKGYIYGAIEFNDMTTHQTGFVTVYNPCDIMPANWWFGSDNTHAVTVTQTTIHPANSEDDLWLISASITLSHK